MKGVVVLFIFMLLPGDDISQEKAPAPPPDTPQQASVDRIYRVGGGVKAPQAIYTPEPDYPKEARKGHHAGPIVLWLIVGSGGQPRDVRVTLGISPEIDKAAVEAVEKS